MTGAGRERGPGCGSEAAGRLEAFYDGELPPAEAERVLAHLEDCGACRARLRELERLDAPVRALEPPPVSAGEWARSWAVIEAAIATTVPVPVPELALSAARFVRRLTRIAAALLVAASGAAGAVALGHARAAPARVSAPVAAAPASLPSGGDAVLAGLVGLGGPP